MSRVVPEFFADAGKFFYAVEISAVGRRRRKDSMVFHILMAQEALVLDFHRTGQRTRINCPKTGKCNFLAWPSPSLPGWEAFTQCVTWADGGNIMCHSRATIIVARCHLCTRGEAMRQIGVLK